jgi:hypothetical protein
MEVDYPNSFSLQVSKLKKVAARFANEDGSVTQEQLIAMAQADKNSVTYDTVLDCDSIEQELLRYHRNWF